MNKEPITSLFCGALLAAGLSVGPLHAGQNTTAKPPDNTKVNKRDKSQSEPTADQAKNNLSDRQIMAHIRRDVVKDQNLSSYAHNVKIVAEHGKVTLKGPVYSDDEKRTIEEYARKYAGNNNVTNELSVKGDSK
jgi:hyperosmotically inducible periplasmic protein